MRALRLSFVATLLALLTLGTSSAEASVPTQPDAGSSALDQCLVEHHSISALFLVDVSGSLKKTDPTNQRVTGLQAAVGALSSLRLSSENSANPVEVFVDFVSFGTSTSRSLGGYRPEWAPLEDDPTGLIDSLNLFASANTSHDTDYVAALEPFAVRADRPEDQIGALEMLERAPQGSCRLLIWFTDGAFDFDYLGQPTTLNWAQPPIVLNSKEDAVSAEIPGISLLCSPGGLADRLRAGDISTGAGAQVAVVALGVNTAATDFDLVGGIADGSMGTAPCGAAPARGVVYPSTDLSGVIQSLVTSVLGQGDGVPAGRTGLPSCTGECGDANLHILFSL